MYKIHNKLNEDIKYIRETVFVVEQGFVDEFDDVDKDCLHILYYKDGKAVGTARVFGTGIAYHIGRVAVLKDYRKYGIGRDIIGILEKKIVELGGSKVELSAQVVAKGFYEKLGYKEVGEVYKDQWCPHIDMVKDM